MGMFDMTLKVADGTSRKENTLRKLDRIYSLFRIVAALPFAPLITHAEQSAVWRIERRDEAVAISAEFSRQWIARVSSQPL